MDARSRTVAPEQGWRLPIVPAPGTGVVTPSCEDRDARYPVAHHVGRMLRIGGEVRLCFACGPEGGVYHPSQNLPGDPDFDEDAGLWSYTMADVQAQAERIFLRDGDGSEPPTPAELRAFEVELRQSFGLEGQA